MIDGDLFIGHHGGVTTRTVPLIDQTTAPCCEPLSAGRLSADDATAFLQRGKPN